MNRKIKKWHVSLIAFALLTCCQNNRDDQIYFNGEIREFNDTEDVQHITLSRVKLDGPYYGVFAVYDSLIIFRNFKLPGYHFNIFNLNTGQELGNYSKKGIGPHELNDTGLIYNLFLEDGEIKTWLFTGPEEELVKWNISKSVQTGETVFDTIVPYKWREENSFASYNCIFSLDENMAMAYVQATSTAPNEKGITIPFYQKRSIFEWGKPLWNEFSEFPAVNTIHIFDWNGNPVKKLIVDHPVNEFWLDQATDRLYTLDMPSDELYVCDLNQLNLK
jgi:hypothetical protein